MPLEWNSTNFRENLDEMLTHVICTRLYLSTCFVDIKNSMKRVCKRNESESVSVSALRVSFPSQMGGCTVFHGGCAVFWGGCAVLQGGCTVFCCGTALTYKLCILLLLCYLGKRHSGTLVIIYPLLCNVSLNIRVKQ